jgi:hypothetical protein
MKQLTAFVFLLLSAPALAGHYGAEISDAEAVSVGKALAQLDDRKKIQTLVRGAVTSVCQKKGCWMGMSSDAGDVRVTFKDYDFFVPFSIVGKTARVEGELQKVERSLKYSKHLARDAGKDPESVTEPIVEYELVATGVEVVD